MNDRYETVIGLEVHVQLATETKIFCGCSTVFGAEPNAHVCPVCLGLPGVLPVLNRKAFEYAIKVALALDCDIQRTVKFDRKNYYYPDLPKNYQISQYDMPLAYNGKITIIAENSADRDIRITRVHMEEDAGKLLHDPARPFSYVDLNRTGTPLLEIVSEPDIRSPEEAYRYLTTLKQVIKYLGVSDCNMEEGSLRCDANISLREKGAAELGSKVEVKNLNSFKAVRDALAFEEQRQRELLEDGSEVVQETRLWDADKNATGSMRTKEEAQDYRYFPEPDLVPFEVRADTVEDMKKAMPELPRDKKKRLREQYKLGFEDADSLASSASMAQHFEKTVESCNVASPLIVCNWEKVEMMKHMNERGKKDVKDLNVSPSELAKLIDMVEKGDVSRLVAKDVLSRMIDTGKDPALIVKEKGLEQVSDEKQLESAVSKVVIKKERPMP